MYIRITIADNVNNNQNDNNAKHMHISNYIFANMHNYIV